MADIRFTCAKVNNAGHIGVLKPNADGYYTVCVGQVNAKNVNGVRYKDTSHFRSLFENSSSFMRQIKAGNLYAELGHPRQQPGESDLAFMRRGSNVEEKNWCAHFKEVWLDDKIVSQRPDLFEPGAVAIMALMKPAGVYASVTQELIDDPDRNLNFSIRCVANQVFEGGRPVRYIDEIINFDLVTDPGMTVANKFSAPTLESAGRDFDIQVTEDLMKRIMSQESAFATESSTRMLSAIQRAVSKPASKTPVFADW